ncbi:MAG: Holliday junction branch migration protein RuvA [Chitinophagaceae bacterium]|jgi:Holliday junction DNA helicase RuvA|nr:Holliday junction branch migration protein RuvA [Chitinophagaceae bacterium]
MIAYLTGNFSYKSPAMVYIDINGVGYEVNISLNTYSAIQDLDNGTLFTYLQIKEDGHTLFGFVNMAEKTMFLQLIGISGVGASTARMMLSSLKPEDIIRAIQMGQTSVLESIKGIGKKTAERIILELKDKLGKNDVNHATNSLKNNTLELDALNALMALGISRPQAEAALRKVSATDSTLNLEQLIKKSLQAI